MNENSRWIVMVIAVWAWVGIGVYASNKYHSAIPVVVAMMVAASLSGYVADWLNGGNR